MRLQWQPRCAPGRLTSTPASGACISDGVNAVRAKLTACTKALHGGHDMSTQQYISIVSSRGQQIEVLTKSQCLVWQCA